MIRILSLVILVLLAGNSAVHAQAPPTSESGQTKILVTFSDPAMGTATRVSYSRPGYKRNPSAYLVSLGIKRSAKRLARDFELEVVDEWPILSLRVHCLVFAVPIGADVDDLLVRLRQVPEVESAQELNEFEVSTGSPSAKETSYVNLQHSLGTLELSQAHQWSKGASIRISIIDTGADIEHPDLKARISGHHDFVGKVEPELTSNAHGTAVAGVIGADAENGVGIIGVAPLSRLEILRACWHVPERSAAVCNSFTLAKALDHAIASNTDIINLSLNGPSDDLLGRLVLRAMADGVVVVAAAPQHSRSGFPAEIDGVIAVGSSRWPQSKGVQHAPQIRAPGTDILVPTPHGGYDYASGSSLSAAHVSGIVALLISSRPRLTSEQVRNLLFHSQSASGGSVNACLALAELLSESGCQTDQLASKSH